MNKLLAVLFGLFATVIGYFLPPPMPPEFFQPIRFFDSLITFALAVFIVGVFNLVQPVRHGRSWLVIRDTSIPIAWILLVWLLTIFFKYMSYEYEAILLPNIASSL